MLAAQSLAIVTGAATGIGLATLQVFLDRGWHAIALDIDAPALQQLAGQGHSRLQAVTVDLVKDDTAVAKALAAVDGDWENVTLVNNVGGSRSGNVRLEALSWDAVADTIAFNLKPMMRLTQLAMPLMRAARQGRVVNVASVTGRTGALDVAADYAAAKGAMVAWARQLVREFASSGILINTICPGIIATARIQERWRGRSAADNEVAMARIPLGRLGTPAEVAEVIHFLGSAANTYMTGAVVDVNGGLFSP